jgi:hypothetical protein
VEPLVLLEMPETQEHLVMLELVELTVLLDQAA